MVSELFSIRETLTTASVGSWLSDRAISLGNLAGALIPPLVVGIVLIALVLSLRYVLLHFRGKSLRVQVTPFDWAAADQQDREAAWVTSLFREELGALRLDALDPLPDRAPGAPLVQVVEGIGQGVGGKLDLSEAIGRLYRAAIPDSAYEVWGTARPCGEGKGRVSVQLVDGRRRTLVSISIDETKWEDGARQAAMAVAGALYPRVRNRHKGPWGHWDKAVPRDLIAAYHEARKDEKSNRLEEAMGAYHRALRGDPLNPHLRLKIAMVQERLALHLDACVTYRAIIDPKKRKCWTGPNRKARIIAMYRLAVLLGNGQIAKQCVASDYHRRTRRDKERRDLRDKVVLALQHDSILTQGLRRREDPARQGYATASGKELLKTLRESEESAQKTKRKTWIENRFGRPEGRTKEERVRQINELLEVISLRWLEELSASVRFRPPLRNRDELREWLIHRPPASHLWHRREFSSSALRVSFLLIRTRIAASALKRIRTDGGDKREIETCFAEHKRLLTTWPFEERPKSLRSRLTSLICRWNRLREDSWQLHYNAACAISSVLLDGSLLREADARGHPEKATKRAENLALPGQMTEAKLVRRAVSELEQYAQQAKSHLVAAQVDWIAIDDPDLAGLAKTDEFKLWASHHLPIQLPEERPQRSTDVNRYTVRIALRGAEAFAGVWRQRAASPCTSLDELTIWWSQEKDAWLRLRDVCHERRSWECRLEALEALQRWLLSAKRPERINFGHEERQQIVAAANVREGLFTGIVALVGRAESFNGHDPRRTLLPWLRTRVAVVQAAQQESPYGGSGKRTDWRDDERREALKAAHIWGTLAEALRNELRPHESGGSTSLTESFRQIRDQLPKVDPEATPPRTPARPQ